MIRLKIKYKDFPDKNEEIICATFWTTNNMEFLHYKTSLDSNIEHVIIVGGVKCDVFIEANNISKKKEGGVMRLTCKK